MAQSTNMKAEKKLSAIRMSNSEAFPLLLIVLKVCAGNWVLLFANASCCSAFSLSSLPFVVVASLWNGLFHKPQRTIFEVDRSNSSGGGNKGDLYPRWNSPSILLRRLFFLLLLVRSSEQTRL